MQTIRMTAFLLKFLADNRELFYTVDRLYEYLALKEYANNPSPDYYKICDVLYNAGFLNRKVNKHKDFEYSIK